MRGLNKVHLIGNVGGDPEGRTTGGGSRVATFSLATSRQWNDHAGQKQESTQWHRIVVWQGLAEVVEKYVSKGSKVYVEGAVEYRKWEDKDGVTRYTTEINARELILLGDAKGAGRNSGPNPPPREDEDFPDFPNGYPPDWDESTERRPAAKQAAAKSASKPAAKKAARASA